MKKLKIKCGDMPCNHCPFNSDSLFKACMSLTTDDYLEKGLDYIFTNCSKKKYSEVRYALEREYFPKITEVVVNEE